MNHREGIGLVFGAILFIISMWGTIGCQMASLPPNKESGLALLCLGGFALSLSLILGIILKGEK